MRGIMAAQLCSAPQACIQPSVDGSVRSRLAAAQHRRRLAHGDAPGDRYASDLGDSAWLLLQFHAMEERLDSFEVRLADITRSMGGAAALQQGLKPRPPPAEFAPRHSSIVRPGASCNGAEPAALGVGCDGSEPAALSVAASGIGCNRAEPAASSGTAALVQDKRALGHSQPSGNAGQNGPEVRSDVADVQLPPAGTRVLWPPEGRVSASLSEARNILRSSIARATHRQAQDAAASSSSREPWMEEVVAAVAKCARESTSAVHAAFHQRSDGRPGGALTRSSFADLLLPLRPDLKPQQLKKLFSLVNASGSGEATFAECAKFFGLDAEERHDQSEGVLARQGGDGQGGLHKTPSFKDEDAFRRHSSPLTAQAAAARRRTASLDPLLLSRVASFVPPLEFLRVVSAASSRWSLAWYAKELRAVIVPNDQPSITAGVNACTGALGNGGEGLVLVRPGVYQEAVRLVRSCRILGLGRRDAVVIEAPGWESPLVFVQGQRVSVRNLTVRCRIQAARGKCVYIPAGQPTLERCRIEGGVHSCGGGTSPVLRGCEILRSPGNGLHFSDESGGTVLDCTIEENKLHGVLADRGARPELHGNRFVKNRGAAIRLLLGSRECKAAHLPNPQAMASIDGNDLSGTTGDGISLGRGFAEGDDVEEVEEEEEAPLFDLFG